MSQVRIVLLYCTKDEANNIMEWARDKDLTGNNYVWIVTQSVIGESRKGTASAKPQFPIGMLGKVEHGIEFKVLETVFLYPSIFT